MAKQGTFESLLRPGSPENSSIAIKYENQIVKSDCEILLEIRCPKSKCTQIFKDRESLAKHVRSAHDLWLCEICLQYKKCFISELELFTRATLSRHQTTGNGKTFSGHPQCPVCATYFYGEDELAEHCRLQHELCHICQRLNRPNRYFQNYSKLEEHFEREHFLCPEPLCKELKFVVFESELEYKRHLAEVHLSHQKMQRSQQRQLQRLNVSFGVVGSSQAGSSSNSRSNNHSSANSSASASNQAALPPIRLTPDQRTQIASNLVFGQVTDDLASRMQSLSLYQQRNEQFMESLRVSFHLNQKQVQALCKDARSFQRSEIDGMEFVNRVKVLVDEKYVVDVLQELVELQLEGLRKRELQAAVADFISKSKSFPALPPSTAPSSSSTRPAWNAQQVTQTKQEKKKVIAPFKGGVLQIKATNPSAPKPLSSANDPSRNPSLLLRELAGGPVKKNKQKQTQSAQPSVKAQLPSFSAAALGNVTTRYAPVPASKQARPQVDDEEFPSLLKDTRSSVASVVVEDSIPFEQTSSKNVFFAPTERDEFESFTIGGEAADSADEKAPMPASGGKKTKKVVFRYGQSWNI